MEDLRKPYEELANAIVLQAVYDYRTARRSIKRSRAYGVQPSIHEAERFFLSGYFTLLTRLDGAALLEQLRKETEK